MPLLHTISYTEEQIDEAIAYLQKNRPAVSFSFPDPAVGKIYFQSSSWEADKAKWSITCSPETVIGSNVSNYAFVEFPNDFQVDLRVAKPFMIPEAGARFLLGANRSWGDNKSWMNHTVEFYNIFSIPQLIPIMFGDGTWQTILWQFKNSSAARANAGMATNIEVVNGMMRFWLMGNNLQVVRKDNFPGIQVGQNQLYRLTVHFSDNPLLGWARLDFNGDNLLVRGANMAPDGGVGAYMVNYGMANGLVQVKKTVITVLD